MKHSSFPRTLLRNICRASLLLLLAAACSNEKPTDEPNPDDKRVTVEFLVPGITSVGTPTRGVSALPEGATVRILVSWAGESYSIGLLKGNQTYYVKGGRLVPCTVDDNGKFIAEDPNGKISLEPWEYDFYVCTPALKMISDLEGNNIPSIVVPQNLDYAASITYKKPIAFTGVVALDALTHECARLQLKVNSDDAAITAMTVKSATLTGFADDKKETYLGHPFYGSPMGGGSKSATTTAFIKDGTNPKLFNADLFLLPCTVTTPVKVAYDITYTVLGIERTETVSADLPTLTLVEGKSYTLTANFAKDGGIHLSISDWEQSDQDNSMGEGVYPYTKDGNIVVWKDNYGGTTATVHEGWFQTPDHKHTDPANSVSACLEVAKSDVSTAWAGWTNTNYLCIAPWRRPTVRELEPIVSLYHSGKLPNIDSFTGRDFATSTHDANRADGSWNVGGSGGTYMDGTANPRFTRCVRDIFVGTTYPYTVNGRFIVSKDAAGSSGAALHANWTQTPDHKNTDPANSVSARFEVAVSNAGSGAWNSTNYLCAAPWRRPTLEEMRLIVGMSLGGKLTGVNSTTGAHYATSTRDANRADGSWNVNGNASGDIFMDGIANPRVTRCIRDF